MPSFDFSFSWIGGPIIPNLMQLNLNGSRSAQNQSQTMRAIRKTVTFTSRPRRERRLAMKSRTGLSLLMSIQIKKKIQKRPLQAFFGRNN